MNDDLPVALSHKKNLKIKKSAKKRKNNDLLAALSLKNIKF